MNSRQRGRAKENSTLLRAPRSQNRHSAAIKVLFHVSLTRVAPRQSSTRFASNRSVMYQGHSSKGKCLSQRATRQSCRTRCSRFFHDGLRRPPPLRATNPDLGSVRGGRDSCLPAALPAKVRGHLQRTARDGSADRTPLRGRKSFLRARQRPGQLCRAVLSPSANALPERTRSSECATTP
jgi:hypothetical protein